MLRTGSDAAASDDDPPRAAVEQRLRSLLEPLSSRGIRPGLATVERLLHDFGDPHLGLAVVLIAGTNGKGSTAAMLTAMARAAGYSAGLYTSPHVEEISEVLSFGPGSADAERTAGELAASLAEVIERGKALDLPLTPFEALTVAALRVMAGREVDVAVLEAGLGGRLDATNVCRPLLAIVTTIGLDHEQFLGPDHHSIAEHKAGIFRPDRPAIIGWCDELEGRLKTLALERGADPLLASEAVFGLACDRSADGFQRVSLATAGHRYALELPLAGAHQARNLALAILAAEKLSEAGFSRLDEPSIAAGCRTVSWPGRLEPMAAGILLDTAHNPAAAQVLLDELERRGEPWELLFGAMADKDAPGMLEILAPAARRIVLTAPDDPRAWDPRRAAAVCTFPATVVPDPRSALAGRLASFAAGDPILVITGSLRLVGQARTWLRAQREMLNRKSEV